VIPKRSDSHRIEIPVGPFYSAVRQAAIVASEESRGIDFTFSNGTLVLSNSTAEVGQSRIEMPVTYDGPELVISLDHQFMTDFLRVLPLDKSFTFDVVNSDQAAYCSTDDRYGYVIMPLARDQR
jgi:DNA polymerase-3 subunit beta